VKKFTNAIAEELRKYHVEKAPMGVDFVDLNMINAFKEAELNWTDGASPMVEARAIKNDDELEAMRIVAAICDACHTGISHFIKPGMQEHQITAFAMNLLYNIPGVEDVEDIIVSSGPNSWPNWRHFSDRIIQPGDLVIIDMAAVTWNGYKAPCTLTVSEKADPGAEVLPSLDWYRAIDKLNPGHHERRRRSLAVSHVNVGLQGRGSGRGQSMGAWPRPGAVRHAGYIADLLPRFPRRNPAGDEFRFRDPAR
jgi:Xaa-Pro aminopeptidase